MDGEETAELRSPERFAGHWKAIGGTPTKAFDALRTRYAQRHRAYHDAEHVEDCLRWLDATADLAANLHELAVAIYFHDAVYQPGATDNEARSAELFRELAAEAGVPGSVSERITRLIEATAEHTGASGDGALLNDIDQAILGSPPPRYARYVDEIRREHSRFSDRQFEAGRTRFLRGLLSRRHIYATPRFRETHEQRARTNILGELRELERRAAAGRS